MSKAKPKRQRPNVGIIRRLRTIADLQENAAGSQLSVNIKAPSIVDGSHFAETNMLTVSQHKLGVEFLRVKIMS